MTRAAERTPRQLVEQFYGRIWNALDFAAVDELLAPDLRFRGSLGSERVGRAAFAAYVRDVTGALAEYRCDIEELVCEGERVFAKMLFGGRHVAPFMGFAPTGREVRWAGAALFHAKEGSIASIWVLGDIHGLLASLERNKVDAELKHRRE